MKRFIIFLIILVILGGIYNFPTLKYSLLGTFGDGSYRSGNFPNADKQYTDVLENQSGSLLLKADTLYNLGNTFYRLGEKAQNGEQLKLWEESVGNYTKSLSIRTDKETEENLAFVKERIEKEKKEQEQKQQEQKKKETEEKTGSGETQKKEQPQTQSGSNQEEKAWQKTDTKNSQKSETGNAAGKEESAPWQQDTNKGSQSKQNWSNQWSYNPLGWQGKDDTDSPLSDADKQEVKKYMEGLRQFQKQNGKLLNPEKSGNAGGLSEEIRNFFGSDSFFQDIIPSDNGKKDW